MFRLAEDVEWSPGKAGDWPESAAALSQEESKKEGKKVSFFSGGGRTAQEEQRDGGGPVSRTFRVCVCVRAIPLANGTCGDDGGNWSRQVNIKVESVNPERRRRRK